MTRKWKDSLMVGNYRRPCARVVQRFMPRIRHETRIATAVEVSMAALSFPHRYQAQTTAAPNGDVVLLGDGLRPLRTAAPSGLRRSRRPLVA
jgi:hypothetical protein